MKLVKLALATAAFVVAAGTVTRAQDVADGTYTFSSTDGDTTLDGSSVTFQSDQIVSWTLQDALASPNSIPPSTDPLTPANSEIASFGLYGPNEWYFIIDSLALSANYYDYFEGQNNLFGPGNGGGLGSLYDGYGDPDGNWAQLTRDPQGDLAPVPDVFGTFQLFVGALTALGALQLYLVQSGRRAAPRPIHIDE